MRLKGGDPLVSVNFEWLKCNCECGFCHSCDFLVMYPEIFGVCVFYRCLEEVGRRWISCNNKGLK